MTILELLDLELLDGGVDVAALPGQRELRLIDGVLLLNTLIGDGELEVLLELR